MRIGAIVVCLAVVSGAVTPAMAAEAPSPRATGVPSITKDQNKKTGNTQHKDELDFNSILAITGVSVIVGTLGIVGAAYWAVSNGLIPNYVPWLFPTQPASPGSPASKGVPASSELPELSQLSSGLNLSAPFDRLLPAHAPVTAPAPAPAPAPVPAPAPAPAGGATRGVTYPDCRAVWEDLERPITRQDFGYGPHLDPDGDGIGCN